MVVDSVAKIEHTGVKLNPLLFENVHIGDPGLFSLSPTIQVTIKPAELAATHGPASGLSGFGANAEKVAQLEGVVAVEKYVWPAEPALARTTAIKYPFSSARMDALSRKPTFTIG